MLKEKTLRIFQGILLLVYLVLYLFPELFEFDSQGWANFLLAFLFGTLIVSGVNSLSKRKRTPDSKGKQKQEYKSEKIHPNNRKV